MNSEIVTETQCKIMNIKIKDFKEMIADSRLSGKNHTLNKTALNKCLAQELGALENTKIRLTHKESTINEKCSRADSKYFKAYAECAQTVECQVKYMFLVKDKIDENNQYVSIQTEIRGQHVHETTNWIRAEERTKLAQEIICNHGGSSHEAKQHAIAEERETPSESVHNKVKAEFVHKDVPTSDWIRNLLFIGKLINNLTDLIALYYS